MKQGWGNLKEEISLSTRRGFSWSWLLLIYWWPSDINSITGQVTLAWSDRMANVLSWEVWTKRKAAERRWYPSPPNSPNPLLPLLEQSTLNWRRRCFKAWPFHTSWIPHHPQQQTFSGEESQGLDGLYRNWDRTTSRVIIHTPWDSCIVGLGIRSYTSHQLSS